MGTGCKRTKMERGIPYPAHSDPPEDRVQHIPFAILPLQLLKKGMKNLGPKVLHSSIFIFWSVLAAEICLNYRIKMLRTIPCVAIQKLLDFESSHKSLKNF